MAERQFGPYRLVRQIAVGGMAEIHLAKTKGIAGFEKYVALKMIHPNFAEDEQFIQMLVDEAKIAVHLTHANIAQTFDLGRVGDTYYITMEYVDGSDLYKILRRASEIDVEMPLDVVAFVGKEMLQALDHAHRKRDHTGKSLGIVHRDVSPQNVLVSYAGEVKLVDFGIAKATSKAKQTAVGVIKGKYYYMSPEQAWGDPIDHRSDIFSAGIVIYEMMVGQMLYLEEDLHRLLDMVRKAEIAPPSKLRKGIPPQLERIVMHALAKVPGERYQSAGDFATDLERFLHGYAPAFSTSKVAGTIRKVLGEQAPVPPEEEPDIEVRDGALSTMELDANLLAHTSEELERDENSMIFSLDELKSKDAAPRSPSKPPPPAKQPTGGQRVAPPTGGQRVAPPTGGQRVAPPTGGQRVAPPPAAATAAPKQPTGGQRVVPRQPTPAQASPVVPSAKPAPGFAPAPVKRVEAKQPTGPNRVVAKPRQMDEHTRELAPEDVTNAIPGSSSGDSGLLALTPRPGPATAKQPSMPAWDASETHPGDDDLDGIGERTMITAPDFLQGAGGGDGDDLNEGAEATMITHAPRGPDVDDTASDDDDENTFQRNVDDDGPTMQRDFTAPPQKKKLSTKTGRGSAAPPALAAKIQTPAVSAIRTPRPSRRTPPGGVPTSGQGNVLQAIVQSQPGEAMPTPSRPPKKTQPPPMPPQSPWNAAAGPNAGPSGPNAGGPNGPNLGQNPNLGQSPNFGQNGPVAGQTGPNAGQAGFGAGGQGVGGQGVGGQGVGGQGVGGQGVGGQGVGQGGYGAPGGAGGFGQAGGGQGFGANAAPGGFGTPAQGAYGGGQGSGGFAQPGYGPNVGQQGPNLGQGPQGQSGPPGQPGQQGFGAQPNYGGYPYQQPQQPAYPNYPQQPGYPQQQQPGYPPQPVTPNALYPVQLYGGPSPMPATLTGALRLTEGDEIPAAYKLDGKKRWFGLIMAGIVAISIAAGVTFLIIRSTRSDGPTVADVKIDSTPQGADVTWDGNRLSDRTPLTLQGVPVGTRHDVKVELAHYKLFSQEVDVPKSGSTVNVMALLEKILGKIAVNSKPSGAEIRINGEIRGRTPTTLTGIDMSTAKTIDVRLKDYQPFSQDLKWPANGQIDLDLTLQPSR